MIKFLSLFSFIALALSTMIFVLVTKRIGDWGTQIGFAFTVAEISGVSILRLVFNIRTFGLDNVTKNGLPLPETRLFRSSLPTHENLAALLFVRRRSRYPMIPSTLSNPDRPELSQNVQPL